jgi:hypothetical protein
MGTGILDWVADASMRGPLGFEHKNGLHGIFSGWKAFIE